MSRHRREIKRQHLKVSCRLSPVHPAEKGREDDIEQQECDSRRKDSRKTPAVETAHGLARLQRHEEECRHNHEQRYARARHGPVIERHPEARSLVGDKRIVPDEPGGASGIEALAGVDQHYQETRDDADVVDEYDALLFHGGKRLCTNINISLRFIPSLLLIPRHLAEGYGHYFDIPRHKGEGYEDKVDIPQLRGEGYIGTNSRSGGGGPG